MISHALCVIGNRRYGKHLNGEKAALIGLYHDASEIITGDMPTPVKYYNQDIRDAYKQVESIADIQLLHKLPEDLRPDFESVFRTQDTEDDAYIRRLVKAADKLSALIKCIEEENAGNSEFKTAKESTLKSIYKMENDLPEVKDFMEDFLDGYGKTLDELT